MSVSDGESVQFGCAHVMWECNMGHQAWAQAHLLLPEYASQMNHHFVASVMCEVTLELLWKPRMQWAAQRLPNVDLKLRVGSGKRTYLMAQKDLSVDATMILNYGVKMVSRKTDPDLMVGWRTAREIHQRGYYQGELTLLNVLAHTMAHEFSHFVQVVLGRAYDGSVHNAEFYAILDRLHASPDSLKIRDALHARCISNEIDLTSICASQAALNKLNGLTATGQKLLAMKDLKPGLKLWFINPKMSGEGPVVVTEKRGKKAVVQQIAQPKQIWLCSPSALSLIPT